MGRTPKRTSLQEDTWMANRRVERCLTLLIIRETQINTTIRYHFTAVRMAIIGHLLQITNAVGGYGKRDPSYTVGENERKLSLSETV